MNQLLAMTIELKWWMIGAIMTVVWAITALYKDTKEGNLSGMFPVPIHGMVFIVANLIIWLIYFIIN